MRRKKEESPKLQPEFVGPYKVVAVFRNYTNQLKRLGQGTVQIERCSKLYQTCTGKRRQALRILANTGCKKPSKTNKKET